MVDGRNLERDSGPPEGRGDGHLGDEIVDLVLGTVESDRRATLVAHVLGCATCRHEYDELAMTVESLLPAVPAAQPPLGFDERVLAGMGRAPGRGRRPWRRRILAAAAAAVVLAVPVGAWLAARDDGGTAAGGVVATLHRTDGDAPVGTVSISEIDGEQVMVVALVGAPPDIAYFCRTRLDDGTVTDSEAWPAGNGAWIVRLPARGDVASVEVLPIGTDYVWSAATFT